MTAAARRANLDTADTVLSRRALATFGVTAHHIDAQVDARRWQRIGPAIVLHNSVLTPGDRALVYLINCGPRAVFTSFTAVEQWGLRGWTRPDVHVLAPSGTTRPSLPRLRLHRPGVWPAAEVAAGPRRHLAAPALVLAASSFGNVRSACGILAAGVQQRLTTAAELRSALDAAPRTRHRRQLLCRRYRLPEPSQQAVRREPGGRRRYLDVEWRLPDAASWRPRSTVRITSITGNGRTISFGRTRWCSAAPSCCATRPQRCAASPNASSPSCAASCGDLDAPVRS